MDGIVVKSKKTEDHTKDFDEIFRVLKKYKVKLNPKKCVFGVSAGNFFKFMVSQRSIKANPKKTRAILEMQPLSSVKEV